jgi:hypothetical protein
MVQVSLEVVKSLIWMIRVLQQSRQVGRGFVFGGALGHQVLISGVITLGLTFFLVVPVNVGSLFVSLWKASVGLYSR